MLFDRDKWQEIFASMRKHKLRTALTALGVFWGIFMLIFILGMGAGLQNGATSNFDNRENNIMYVWASPTTKPYKGFQPGRRPRFKLDDVKALKVAIPEIKYIAPNYEISGPISYGEQTDNWEIRGEMPDKIEISSLSVLTGRYINQTDVDEARKVVVIGDRVREVLFEDADPIGRYVRIRGVSFQVIGTYGPRSMKPWNQDDLESVTIPLTAMYRSFGTGERVHSFACMPTDGVSISSIEDRVRSLLRERHNVAPDDPRGIGGFNLEEEFKKINNLFLGINSFLWFVGIGTLLAGIVGVGNIMLILVKERTKEIGIRKAMGATPNSIISMVLTESVFITAFSGYLGLLCGTLVIWGISAGMEAAGAEAQNFHNPEVNIGVGIAALIILIIAGLFARTNTCSTCRTNQSGGSIEG